MRAAGILVLCLFSSILSTVTSLKCEQCVALGTECEEDNVKVAECKEDKEFCSTVVVNSTLSKTLVSLIIKECSKRERCYEDIFSSTTVDDRFEIAKTKCCQTDVCNAEPLLLEKYEDFQPNGLQCPACFALDEDSCEANQPVACVGKEDQCLTITCTTVAEFFGNFTQKSTYQGCATQATCFIPLGVSVAASGLIQFNITTVECRNASSSEPNHQ
ncbi:PREDICTED: phospholipase A2 inhibitor 25 kDa subunit-like [Thamnophis sirtalis]|uniref:Phospholipase A2 inhibitor 25 kDa subunit-like n=1 Tax=Thamnophis sirtalis TaxID=35019 RepID=A0A6I9Z7H0_9SAUR|nr:PREDICTED: phospholipase A2 inhibitor 25 kDa subunit-like [Thamnophis sirtalis]